MTTFKERVWEEKNQLDEKMARLNAFIDSESLKAIPQSDQYLLHKQSAAMLQYSRVLAERINNFKD
jgi:hypothetical protein